MPKQIANETIEQTHANGAHATWRHERAHAVVLGRAPLTIPEVVAVAREGARVRLSPAAVERVRAARAVVERITEEGRTVYGITTGFGRLSDVKIPHDQLAELQHNLIRSHSSGVGEPFDVPTTRAAMLLLANSLSRGYSGVRVELIEQLLAMLNAGVTPVVPKRGSVGASGDLAPLAHLALVIIGEGEALVGDERLPGAQALVQVGLRPMALAAKEGLALINGTHIMAAVGALAVHDAKRLLRAAEVTAAMTVEALLGSYVPFDARISALRPQPGQVRTAARMRALLEGSEINPSHANCGRVQDPYSLRCIPQVLGATRDALAYGASVFEAELESVTDNPLDLSRGRRGAQRRQLPRRAAGPRAGHAGDRGGADGGVLQAAHLQLAGAARLGYRRARHPALPHAGAGAALGLHDRAVCGGGARQRDWGARPPGQHRLDPHLRRPGGLRQHGRHLRD